MVDSQHRWDQICRGFIRFPPSCSPPVVGVDFYTVLHAQPKWNSELTHRAILAVLGASVYQYGHLLRLFHSLYMVADSPLHSPNDRQIACNWLCARRLWKSLTPLEAVILSNLWCMLPYGQNGRGQGANIKSSLTSRVLFQYKDFCLEMYSSLHYKDKAMVRPT